MTAREIMSYIDDIKEDIPDGIYLNLANMLKKQKIKKRDDFKLVQITYIKTGFRRARDEDNEEEDYVLQTDFHTRKVYFNENCNTINQGDCFEFKNNEGLEIIEEGSSEELILYHPTKKGNDMSIAYDKYILVSMKDC